MSYHSYQSIEFPKVSSSAPDMRTMMWLLSSLALVVAPHLQRLPLWFLGLFLSACALRLWQLKHQRRSIPGWIKLALTLLALVGIWLEYGTLLSRQANIGLLCVMLALKIMETAKRRDIYLLISMAYFVAITQFLFNQSFYLTLYLLGVVVVITATLIVIEHQPMRQLSSRHDLQPISTPRLVQSALRMLLFGIPLMAALFLFFPRLGSPMWGVPQDALNGKTGISDEMEPGKILELFLDDSPAFRVEFEGPVPPPAQRYWRGPTLWNFDGRKWTRMRPMGYAARIDPDQITDPIRYSLTMEPTQNHWVFGLDRPVQLPSRTQMEIDMTMFQRRPITTMLQMDMVSDPDYPVDVTLWQPLREAALRLPEGFNPRTQALADQWREEIGKPELIVQRALAMFNQEGFEYSYTPPPLGRHTIDDFLFETRSGYCEYYSSAFTALMRAAGIPARVVTGYQGGFFNEESDYMVVRQSDAHAWSEVWFEGLGWMRVDPTAAVAADRVNLGALDAFGGSRGFFDYEWMRELRNRFDAVQRFWNQQVINFDKARQQNLLKPLGIDNMSLRQSLIALTLICSAILALALWRLIRQQERRDPDRIHQLYLAFQKRMKSLGIEANPAEGPIDFAMRCKAHSPDLADRIDRVIEAYVHLRYAGNTHPSVERQLKDGLRALT